MKHLNEIELVMALDGELEPYDLKRAVDHLAECGACRAQWENLQGVSAKVEEYQERLYPTERTPFLPMRASTREQIRAAKEKPRNTAWARFPNWGLAVAAVVLISVGVGVFAFRTSGSKEGPHTGITGGLREVAARETAPEVGPLNRDTHATATISVPSLASNAARKNSQENRPIKTPAASKPDKTLAQFTELPFSDASLPLEDATVVRVTLPAAALRQAGVAVEEDSANAMLQAEVVLGIDGLPRGIRLLNSSGANNAIGNN